MARTERPTTEDAARTLSDVSGTVQKGNKMSDAEKIALLLGTLKSCKLELTMIEPFLSAPYQKGITAAKERCGEVIDEVEVSA